MTAAAAAARRPRLAPPPRALPCSHSHASLIRVHPRASAVPSSSSSRPLRALAPSRPTTKRTHPPQLLSSVSSGSSVVAVAPPSCRFVDRTRITKRTHSPCSTADPSGTQKGREKDVVWTGFFSDSLPKQWRNPNPLHAFRQASRPSQTLFLPRPHGANRRKHSGTPPSPLSSASIRVHPWLTLFFVPLRAPSWITKRTHSSVPPRHKFQHCPFESACDMTDRPVGHFDH